MSDMRTTPPRVLYAHHPHLGAARAALEAVAAARVAIVILVLDPDPGDPDLYPTHFVTVARPGKDVSTAHYVAALRAHAQALETLDRQRAAGAEADKGGGAVS